MRVFNKLLASMRRPCVLLAVAMLFTVAGIAHAQSASGDDSADPPGRVARLSYIAGDLGLLPAGASDWSDADVNRPLTTGDKLSSGADARAELEFGGATLRLDNRTDVGLLNLNEQLAQIELTQGTLNLSVRHLDDGQSYEIDTPTVALVINQPGQFRVDIDGDATRITAFEGDATVYGENNAQRDVFAGRSYRFVDSSLAAVAISDIGGGDSFDAWVDQRDQLYAQSDSSQYVPDDMVGAPDLQEYGAWDSTSDYGPVWYPNDVGADWAPYRTGHWAYIAPWGWSWIDAMPWGFAPYHYGRWAHTPRGWGWIPGPRSARPIYAPALVAFVGGGFSAGIGSGPVGWFPLGPGEIYNPWYRCNRDYYRRVNVSNIRLTRALTHAAIVNRIDDHYGHYRDNRPLPDERYVNRHAPGGFSAMSGRQFAAGDRVQRNLVNVDQRELASARVMPRGVDVRPLPRTQAGQRSAHVRQLPLNGFRREVVAHHAPGQVAARHIEPTGNPADARRAVATGSNVRVLDPRASTPRPGVSYLSGADEDARRATSRAGSTLPQAPRIQRNETIDRSGAARDERLQRYPINPERSNAGVRDNPEPRFQRPESAGQNDVRDEPRAQPVGRESPQPFVQQPRYEPPRFAEPQRTAPPPRAEASRPQHSEARPERRGESQSQKDGHPR